MSSLTLGDVTKRFFIILSLLFLFVLPNRGKGDYYRLGHGSEEHVRRPKRIFSLESKIITSICCGSLHCVATTGDGEVYCWGDNDEGQLGDGTTEAGHQPKLCTTLQVTYLLDPF